MAPGDEAFPSLPPLPASPPQANGNGSDLLSPALNDGDHADEQQQQQQRDSIEDATASELRGLALTSTLTELGMSIENTKTLIFQVQELRHAADGSDAKEDDREPNSDLEAASLVDAALLRLDEQLDNNAKEVSAVQHSLDRFLVASPAEAQEASFLKHKWKETLENWQNVQRDAVRMREELAEDKYLVVYRTVSKQAEEMMQSLEKVFLQCHNFVPEMHRRYGGSLASSSSSSSSTAVSDTLEADLNTFISLHNSLHQKRKYYLPSCSKVLGVIDTGIAQQKSVNGEVLRSHADMKMRWRNLQERMHRVEMEMESVQELFSELNAARASTSALLPASLSGTGRVSEQRRHESYSPSKTGESSSTSRPMSGLRRKTADWLSPSPSRNHASQLSSSETSPTISRTVSPFRKLTGRIKSASSFKLEGESPPPPVPSLPTGLQNSTADQQRHSQHAGTVQTQGYNSNLDNGSPLPSSSRPVLGPRKSAPQHRHTQSAAGGALSGLEAINTSSLTAAPPYHSYLRPRSPLPRPATGMSESFSTSGSATENRPRWNASTRLRDDGFASKPSAFTSPNKIRKSLQPQGTPSRGSTSTHAHDQGTPRTFNRTSSFASNANTTPSLRSDSPTFSVTSELSASAYRVRPTSPNSRIPAPSSSVPASRTGHRRPSINALSVADDNDEDVETLQLRSPATQGERERALSPTPSTSTSASGRRRQSHIPRLSISASSSTNTPSAGPALSSVANFDVRDTMMTPEPLLRTRAARAGTLYAGNGSSSGRKSVGSAYPTNGTPRARQNPDSFRSPSRSGASTPSGFARPRRSITPSPLFASTTSSASSSHAAGPYTPNPVDPLDLEVAAALNSQPLFVPCERVDLPLTKAAAEAQAPSDRMARYRFGWSDGKDVPCKLIDRGGSRGRKVLCKVGGEWQDLSLYLSNLAAKY